MCIRDSINAEYMGNFLGSGLIQQMVLPLIKVASLFLKVFTKPLVNYTKRYHMGSRGTHDFFMRKFFIRLGQAFNRYEVRINRRYLKIKNDEDFSIKLLNDEVAIQKGVEFFYELVVYGVLVAIPIWEMQYDSNAAAEKAALERARVDSIQASIKKTKVMLQDHFDISAMKVENMESRYTLKHTKLGKEVNRVESMIESLDHRTKKMHETQLEISALLDDMNQVLKGTVDTLSTREERASAH
eukprot:TRINITY_DN2811_c0_g1_i1.p1 TRINITY_DN2811_c0_g1~~TRINITY_DN2811_c0_g1_i1.p1  ORF type:complete len:242 (-),score=45.97 TRINITY_DN2811_c0_g1_i1:123-848(-)